MVDVSKIILSIAELNPEDTIRRVGGFHTLLQVRSDVDDVFQPGWCAPSDFPTDTFDQYRKVFWRNETGETLIGCKIYGFNVTGTNIKFAIEKDLAQDHLINGSEVTQNYQTPPQLYGEYVYTELQAVDARLIGNAGVLQHQEGQGIWLRQRITTATICNPSDEFIVGFVFSDTAKYDLSVYDFVDVYE